MSANMSNVSILLVISVSLFALIRGELQTSGTHFCEALESNQNKIDYALSFPVFHQDYFIHKIAIRGVVWEVNLGSSSSPNSSNIGGQPMFELKSLYGGVLVNFSHFNERDYECVFGTRIENRRDRVFIGGVTKDFKNIVFIILKPAQKRKRQSNTYSTPDPKWIYEFKTEFEKTDYRPEVAFNTMLNIDAKIANFIETKIDGNGSYINDFQSYDIIDNVATAKSLKNVTSAQSKNIPKSLLSVAAKYLVKGFFPFRERGSKVDRGIILVETCSTGNIPCTGAVTYKYCIVADSEASATDANKPCHPNNLILFYDCNNWKIKAGWTERESTLTDVTIESLADTLPESDGTEAMVGTAAPVKVEDTTEPPKEKSGMWWLWILIILIIIIIIIILLFLCFLRKKGKKVEGSDEPPPPGLAQNSSLSTVSQRSGFGGSGSAQSSKIGDSLSTTSTRSQTGAPKASSSVGAKTSTVPSSMSTPSTRSKAN